MAKQSGIKSEYPFKTINNLFYKFDLVKNPRFKKFFYPAILVFGLLLVVILIFIYRKSWFIAATVNGAPITNFELLSRLNKQFRTQTLNQMINEKILMDEATKMGTTLSEPEINQKISELEQSVGGAQVLDNLLTQQGQTRVTLRDQVRLQITISKLYDKEATVSAQAVADFIKTNKATLQATESAKQQEEAFNILKQQKLSQIFNQKFQELRQKANIKIF